MGGPVWSLLGFAATLVFGLANIRRPAPGGWPWGPHPASWRDERRQWSWVLQCRVAIVVGAAGSAGCAVWLAVT
jgi:hypothetical protein